MGHDSRAMSSTTTSSVGAMDSIEGRRLMRLKLGELQDKCHANGISWAGAKKAELVIKLLQKDENEFFDGFSGHESQASSDVICWE